MTLVHNDSQAMIRASGKYGKKFAKNHGSFLEKLEKSQRS